jgi:hypothetical protein
VKCCRNGCGARRKKPAVPDNLPDAPTPSLPTPVSLGILMLRFHFQPLKKIQTAVPQQYPCLELLT